ncbi:hypothetical protein Cni_G00235 [Canna indica]|uniref:Uncharacterized protein n=1 Tax=Canna indica TaxID=4628 RepID=A0AAQ3JMF8_9LILI|nr:hypothetical protein Cni_G00235 [Canna indica]
MCVRSLCSSLAGGQGIIIVRRCTCQVAAIRTSIKLSQAYLNSPFIHRAQNVVERGLAVKQRLQGDMTGKEGDTSNGLNTRENRCLSSNRKVTAQLSSAQLSWVLSNSPAGFLFRQQQLRDLNQFRISFLIEDCRRSSCPL